MKPGKLTVAKAAVHNCVARIDRLYEQGVASGGIGEYVRRWVIWARTGLGLLQEGAPETGQGHQLDVLMPLLCVTTALGYSARYAVLRRRYLIKPAIPTSPAPTSAMSYGYLTLNDYSHCPAASRYRPERLHGVIRV